MLEIATITSVLGLVGNGIKTIDSAKALFDSIARKAEDGDVQALKLQFAELVNQLLEAKTAQLEAQNALLDMRSKIERENEFQQKLNLYEPKALPHGGQILVLKMDARTSGAFPRICPHCLATTNTFAPLQGRYNSYELKCNSCGGEYPNQPRFVDRPSWDADIWPDY